MMQIGNFHIGKAETAEDISLNYGEVQTLWDHLHARYKCIEKTQMYHHFAHDPEFKLLIGKELKNTLGAQVNELELFLERLGIPLPKRPPKSVGKAAFEPQLFTDEYMFNDIYTGCENFIDSISTAIRNLKYDNALRKKFMGYLINEIEVFDDLTKYGKLKGWLELSPRCDFH